MDLVQDKDFQAVGAPRPVSKRRTATRIGYIGLVDAAPLLVADQFGLFESKGLNVTLSREVGWATIREKVLFGELEAAHALCTLPYVATLGIGSTAMPCVSGMILSRGGNAVVLSEELRHRGVKSKETLKLDVENRKAFRKYKIATVYDCSPHNFHLREWLSSAGIDPNSDVELVTLPPAQMCRNLAAGTIDGFCAGEPWASLAIRDKIGWSPVNSEDLTPSHPEKVLMMKQSFAEEQREESAAMIAALIEACAICEDPSQRTRIAELLSDRKRVNCPVDLLEECLSPTFNYGLGRVENRPGFLQFHNGDSTRPTAADGDWVLSRLAKNCLCKSDTTQLERLKRVLRPDLYEEALKLVEKAPISR
ncbi:ABC transporter substrate-binding protein [Pelagicoccus mobilis]|uniref:ABC transporter substrate-binding protein n=1 Tax=Pelagicoccus mobilis TaxID=415221 RepID=A0A934RVQ0_9BACT|nr:ABC transporter substrate-binding protein [Pelagicoccus mobilis]MBK1877346.1 ABC transporter substrate-binding protein [Pelagicoccus mobilis]